MILSLLVLFGVMVSPAEKRAPPGGESGIAASIENLHFQLWKNHGVPAVTSDQDGRFIIRFINDEIRNGWQNAASTPASVDLDFGGVPTVEELRQYLAKDGNNDGESFRLIDDYRLED
jgi:hypothetical protein